MVDSSMTPCGGGVPYVTDAELETGKSLREGYRLAMAEPGIDPKLQDALCDQANRLAKRFCFEPLTVQQPSNLYGVGWPTIRLDAAAPAPCSATLPARQLSAWR